MTEILNALKGLRGIVVQAAVALVGILVAVGLIPASEAIHLTAEYIGQQFDVILGGLIALSGVVAVVRKLVFGKKTPQTDNAPSEGGAG